MNIKNAKTILFLLLCIINLFVRAQDQSAFSCKIINDCLLKILEDKIKRRMNSFVENDSLRPTYIVSSNLPEEFSLDSIGSKYFVKFIRISNPNLYSKSELKLLKKGITGIFFPGFKFNGNRLYVNFTFKSLTYKKNTEIKEHFYKKKLFFEELSGGCNFIYEYSCEKQEWVFIKVDYWGI